MQSAYFDRDDVALKGFSKYFWNLAMEEFEHAQYFLKFQNMRGGRIELRDIPQPKNQEWSSG